MPQPNNKQSEYIQLENGGIVINDRELIERYLNSKPVLIFRLFDGECEVLPIDDNQHASHRELMSKYLLSAF